MIGWLRTAICALNTEEGRRGWAMLAALGCAVTMTVYAVAVLWIVKKNPMLAFWLGLASMGIILIVITGLMVLLGVKRRTKVKSGDNELDIEDV